MTSTQQKKKAKISSTEELREAYIRQYCLRGHRPASIYAFCDEVGMPEGDFYSHYTSFDQLESSVWIEAFDKSFGQVISDEGLRELSVREQFIAFSFAWVEILKNNRSFYQLHFKDQWSPLPGHALKKLRGHAKSQFKPWISDGSATGEIEQRFKLSDHYDEALWILLVFITGFWVKDDSLDFEKTDAAIEKSVNLAFDILSKGSIDSALDLGKFLFQNYR